MSLDLLKVVEKATASLSSLGMAWRSSSVEAAKLDKAELSLEWLVAEVMIALCDRLDRACRERSKEWEDCVSDWGSDASSADSDNEASLLR